MFYVPHGCSCMKKHVFHSTATTSHRGNLILGWRYCGRTGEDSRPLSECVAADVYRCSAGGMEQQPSAVTVDGQTTLWSPSHLESATWINRHTDTGSRPSLLTHTHHKCLQWWSTWQSATRPAAKYTRACFDAWITLNCTADTVSIYHPLHSWQQIKTHNVLNLTHITSFPWGQVSRNVSRDQYYQS